MLHNYFSSITRQNRISAFVILFAVLAGCTPAPKLITLEKNFNAAAARELLLPGNNTIAGSALMRERDGRVVTCAGKEVLLIPHTEYAVARMRNIFGGGGGGVAFYEPEEDDAGQGANFLFADTPAEYFSLMARTLCDAHGFFVFRGVADGAFFVRTEIDWKYHQTFSGTLLGYDIDQGGLLMRRVEVRGGEVKEIVLAP